ncbi:MAG: murein biosynthesis integral membrane protein MurJ [Eubacteriales bacterium]|nr:murein biosynthesis integral membrane protein MurJ [Eubacteriales bacterium]MDD4186581.1 murein biosynthesis integral membrane protein MurJ [Eubacteriales bacterium]
MSQAKKAARSVLIIILFTVASKLLGFVREMMMAARYGSDASTDAYFMALSALSLFSIMITKTLFQTTIPVLTTVENVEGKEGKNRHTNNLLNIVIVFSFVAAILAWFFTPYILKILAPGFGEEQFNLTITLTRIGLSILVISGVVGVFRGYLQSELRFTESAATMIPFNLIFIIFLIFFSKYFDIRALMIANVLANLGMLALQIPSIRKAGFRYAPVFELKDDYVKHIAILMPPILLSSVINDVNTLIDKSLASKLVEGSISALNYADRIKGLVTSIFISAIATVIFPILAKNANNKNLDNLKKTMIRGFNVIILITIPASLGLMVLAHPIVRFVFERKAFDARATTMTAGALLFYSIGLLSLSMNTMFRQSSPECWCKFPFPVAVS